MVQSTRARRARAETSSASEDTSDAATADTASDGDVHTATRPNGARKPRKSAPVSTSRSTAVPTSRGARKSARTILPPGPESQVIHLKHDASQESDTGDSEPQGTLTSTRPHAASRRTARKHSTRPKHIEPPSGNDEQQDQEDDAGIQENSDDEGDEQDTTVRQSPPRQPVKSKAARSPAKRAASPADDDDDEDEASEIEEGTDDGRITTRSPRATRETAKKVNFDVVVASPKSAAVAQSKRRGSPQRPASTLAPASGSQINGTIFANREAKAAKDLPKVAEAARIALETFLDKQSLDLTEAEQEAISKYGTRRSLVVDLSQGGGHFMPVQAALRNANHADAQSIDLLSFLTSLLMLYSDYDAPAVMTLESIHRHFAHIFPKAQLRQTSNMKLRIAISLQIVIAIRLFREQNVERQDYLDPGLTNSPAYNRALHQTDRKNYRTLATAVSQDVSDEQLSVTKLRIKYPFEDLVKLGVEEARKAISGGFATGEAEEGAGDSHAAKDRPASRRRQPSGGSQLEETQTADEGVFNRSFHTVTARLASSAGMLRPASSPAVHRSRQSLDRIRAMSSPYKKPDNRRRSEPFANGRSIIESQMDHEDSEIQRGEESDDSDSDADDIERHLLGSANSDTGDVSTQNVHTGFEMSDESEGETQYETQAIDDVLLAEPSVDDYPMAGAEEDADVAAEPPVVFERLESTEEPEQTQATQYETQPSFIEQALRAAVVGDDDVFADLPAPLAPDTTGSRAYGFDDLNRIVLRQGGARTRSTLLDRQDDAVRIAMDSPTTSIRAPETDEATPRAARSSRARQSKAEPPSSAALVSGLKTSSAIKNAHYLDRSRHTPTSKSPPVVAVASSEPADNLNMAPDEAEAVENDVIEIGDDAPAQTLPRRKAPRQSKSSTRKSPSRDKPRKRSDFEPSSSSVEMAAAASRKSSKTVARRAALDAVEIPSRPNNITRSTTRHTDVEHTAKSQRPASASLPAGRRNVPHRQQIDDDDPDGDLPEIGEPSVAVSAGPSSAPAGSPRRKAAASADIERPGPLSSSRKDKGKKRAAESDEDELDQNSSQEDNQDIDKRIRRAVGPSTKRQRAQKGASSSPRKKYDYHYKVQGGTRRWTAEQDRALVQALEDQAEALTAEELRNHRVWDWGRIIQEHGSDPDDPLYGKNNVQLKDRATNIAIKRNRDGLPRRPWYSKKAG